MCQFLAADREFDSKIPSVHQTLCLSLGHVAFPPHTYWLSMFALSGAYWGIRLILKGKI